MTESQLMLLRAMRFIDYENETIKTVLPILGLREKQSLTQRVRRWAQQIEPELNNEIHKQIKILSANTGRKMKELIPELLEKGLR